jgi:hypothetical protein
MQNLIPGKQDSYDVLANHLLSSESPLNYSLEYLLENYGEKAVPALMQALPVRPWFEQEIILEALGKLGDHRAIVPICALIYGEGESANLPQNSLIVALRNLVYYCADKKKATRILIDTIIRYKDCLRVITPVLKDCKDKYTIKMVYRKLFKNDRTDLKAAAITIVGEENTLTEYRIKYLKKMHFRVSDSKLRDQTIAALKILISKKRCKCLCQKKGLKFDAFFRRPENESYDCCCVDKNNKRVLIKFEGSLVSRDC